LLDLLEMGVPRELGDHSGLGVLVRVLESSELDSYILGVLVLPKVESSE